MFEVGSCVQNGQFANFVECLLCTIYEMNLEYQRKWAKIGRDWFESSKYKKKITTDWMCMMQGITRLVSTYDMRKNEHFHTIFTR